MSADADFARARRVAACKHFRPMPGMADLNGWRISAVHAGAIEWSDSEWCSPPTPSRIEPDLRDPATLGCLLALWMEAWPAELDDRERRVAEIQDAISDHDTGKLADALVAALESAP